MNHLLCLTTAISLVVCASASQASPLWEGGGASGGLLPQSRYETLRKTHAYPSASPVMNMPKSHALSRPETGVPEPIVLASADTSGMAIPTSITAPMPVQSSLSEQAGVSPSLIPVLPRPSYTQRPLLYPSKVSYAPMPRVLPVPGEANAAPVQNNAAAAPAELLPVPQAQESVAEVPAYTTQQATTPTILPLPDVMASGQAMPDFKSYATIESQTGSVAHDMTTAQALKELDDVEAQVNAMVPSTQLPAAAAPSLAPSEMAATQIPAMAISSPVSSDVPAAATPSLARSEMPVTAALAVADNTADMTTPALLPLPDDMEKADVTAQRTPRSFAPEAAPADHLSDDSRQILANIPGGLDAPKSSGGKLSMKRYNPEVEGVLKRNRAQDDVASMEGDGVSIRVSRPSLNADYELQRAYEALSDGASGEAVEIYRDVLASYPRNEQALFGVAATYHQMGELDKARSYYKRLLAINPAHRDGLNNFLVLISDEAPQEALHQLQRLEQRNPSFSPIPAQMAIIYSKTGNLDAAKSKMQQALRLAPGNLAYQYNLAIIMDKLGAYPQAASLYRALVAASQRGEELPTDLDEIQQRLVYIDRVSAN